MRRPSTSHHPSPAHDANAAAGSAPPRPAELVPAGHEPHAVAPAGAPSETAAILDVIARAARDPDVNVEKMRELFALKEKIEAAAAKRAFYAALARAKGEFGPILKTRQVDYPHKQGEGRTSYKYEELADVGQAVDPVLSKHGLSYRHKSTQEANGKIRVTCILSHEDGYSEENSLEGFEDKSGQKNPNQAIASTVTYLQRYTLKEALGLGAGRDDDAAGGGDPDPVIEADDVAYVETLIRDTDSDLAKFLETIEAPSIAEMRLSQYKRAIGLLNRKKRMAASGTTVG
jgi:ERF superfamily protein